VARGGKGYESDHETAHESGSSGQEGQVVELEFGHP
jgi:hypothetical protein